MSITPKPLPEITSSDIERFWQNVERKGLNECWPWKGSSFAGGYGQFKVNGRTVKAHRMAYFLTHGEDPLENLVCHTCDNPPCCNGFHLNGGTAQENTADMITKGRFKPATGENHGSKRHPERWARGERVHGAKVTPEIVREIRNLYSQGNISQEKLGAMFGIKRETVGKITRGENWLHVATEDVQISLADPHRRGKIGEDHRGAKLKTEQVIEIRQLYQAGNISQKSLAHRFNTTPENIASIVKRRSWKHLP